VTVFESLKNRAGLIVSGAASFIIVVGAMRLAAGEPLVQPQADAGIVVGVALVTLFLVVGDRRGGLMSSGPSAQSRNV
jgi:hypothetical protein